MKRILILTAFAMMLLASGCAKDDWQNKNPLSNLTDKQADWFDRTNEGWRFED